MKWQVLHESLVTNKKEVLGILLENRGLKTKKEIDEFLQPKAPKDITFKDLGIDNKDLKKVIDRLNKAKKNKEKVIVFGDYDADGVSATAILWEALYKLGFNALPFIPNRFEDGYGLKAKSFDYKELQPENCSLLITVDNGIVAYDGIKEAKKRGIDVIVVDHHTKGTKKLPTEFCLHSTLVCGSALSWFLAKELGKEDGLDLVALGTIADQMPLLKINRSLVKYGLVELTKTKRVGLKALFRDLKIETVGVYEVGYIIAPRINAMGRLRSATDSLRFLCTRDPKKASDLNRLLNETNIERQKIVDEVLISVLKSVTIEEKIIVIDGEYHEGVIGLASGKVTERFYRPSIVLSVGKDGISKASARSINGFNIIEAIKETGLIIEGGGHPMAAGFSIETKKILEFKTLINELAKGKLTDEIMERKLKIDLELSFQNIDTELLTELKKFEPTGFGNFAPVFVSRKVKIVEIKPVGSEGKHLKLKFEQNNKKFDAIAFGMLNNKNLKAGDKVDVAYTLDENVWNNKTSIQLKVKDIKI